MLRGSLSSLGLLLAIAALWPTSCPAQSSPAGYAYYSQPFLGQGIYDLTTIYSQASSAIAEDHRAYTALNLTVFRLQRQFMHSSQYKATAQDVQQAQDALDNARKPILDTVAGDPHYQDLAKKRNNVDTILSEGGLPARDVLQLAARKMDYGSEMRRMEALALNNDASVTAARARLVAAQKHVDEMRQDFEDHLYQNPTWAAAKQSYDNAEIAVAGAEGAVVGANITADVAFATATGDFSYRYGNLAYDNFGYGGYGLAYPAFVSHAYYHRRY